MDDHDFEDRLVEMVSRSFRSFGGGAGSESSNPIAQALKDSAPQFAAGVDIRGVVQFVRSRSGSIGPFPPEPPPGSPEAVAAAAETIRGLSPEPERSADELLGTLVGTEAQLQQERLRAARLVADREQWAQHWIDADTENQALRAENANLLDENERLRDECRILRAEVDGTPPADHELERQRDAAES